MLIKVGQKFETWMRKVLPDPLVIAIILTLIVGLLAVIFTPTTPIQVVENWSKGFWELIAFTMQVAFGLIAGAVPAKSPIVNRGMVKLCSLLQNQYRHNILVLLHCNGNGEKLLEDNNIEYVKIRSFNWFVPYKPKQIIRKIKLALCYIWMPLSQVYNIIAIRKIRRLIKKEKIQIVHINTSCSYVGAQAALLENIPFVWHIREFLEEDQERCIWNNKKGYSLIGEANRVVAISDSIYQKYKKLLPEADIVTIYNGIDSDDFYIDHKDLFSGNGINLAIVGSINRSKGQDQAIKACEILIEEGIDNINLRIAGKESEYVNFLRNYVGSKNLDKWIQFIGPQSDIKQLYRDTDIVLMCSQSEAFGRVTVEAMMSGCLVIGANSGGTMELVSDNETGLLYTSGDYSDLAAKIRLALKYPDRMRDIAKQGQSKMLNEMTAQNNAFRINELYREIVSDTEGI